jgi:uncharacterized DUF497 family protein
MIDWACIEGFEWDYGNVRKRDDKHRVSQTEVEQMFFNQPLLIAADPRHSMHEPRFQRSGEPTGTACCTLLSPSAALPP